MRILALTSEFPPYRGGIATYALEMARAAQELGADVTIAAPDFGKYLTTSDLGYPFRIVRFRGNLHRMSEVPAKSVLVKKMLRESRYDLIHAMDWPFFLPAALWGRQTKRLYTVHGSDVVDMGKCYKRLAIKYFKLFSGNYEVVSNSSFTKNLFLKTFPDVDETKIRCELLGVSKFWTEDVPVVPSERNRLGLPDNKFVIVTVARLTPRKNQLGIIDALNCLPEAQRKNVCYAIVGPAYDSGYAKIVRRAITATDLDVRLLGEIGNEKLRRVYASSDLFCLVGKTVPGGQVEGFGLVFLEAGGQGLPALAGNIGGVREAVLDNNSGILIPVDNPAALVDALSNLMNHPDKLRALRAGARRRAIELSWHRCAAATYGLKFA